MEGQAPWMKQATTKKKETVAAAVKAPAPAVPPPAAPATTITAFAGCQLPDMFLADLSCASIVEIPNVDAEPLSPVNAAVLSCLVAAGLNTILDSGTTTTLIQDRSYFWTYSTADIVTVKTANHGSLNTSGRGDCVAILTIANQKHCVRLTNCLHASTAMLNLLSVGWMLSKGWDCTFRVSPPCCELVYRGTELGSIPMANNLCYVNLAFLPAPSHTQPVPTIMSSPSDLTAFMNIAPSLDLWHARLGHIGSQAVCRLVPASLPLHLISPGVNPALWANTLVALILLLRLLALSSS